MKKKNGGFKNKFGTKKIYVHLDGKIKNPGVIEIEENSRLNDAIEKCNTEIKKKIANPFEPILGVEFGLREKRAALVSAISDLEVARVEHNKPFLDISKIKSGLQVLNKQKAYYEILPIHETYLKQLKEKEDADSMFKQLKEDALTKKKCRFVKHMLHPTE